MAQGNHLPKKKQPMCAMCFEVPKDLPSSSAYCYECRRAYPAMRRYGLGREQYLEMMKQDCAICGADASHDGTRLAIDHCHETGKVRGVLCTHCNHGLGKFKDDASLLERAIAYLGES